MSHLTPVPSDPVELRAWLDRLAGSQVDAVLERLTPVVTLPDAPEIASSLTVKLTLKETKPPVWRRLVLAGDTPLDQVHDIIQTAMGWLGGHLHQFHTGPGFRDPTLLSEWDVEEGEEGTAEADVRLDQLLVSVGDRVLYQYDFGDGWDHELRLEKVEPLAPDAERRPRCLTGRLACPPEDCGGAYGYAELAIWVRAGRPADRVPDPFDSVADALEWLPIDWDPDVFDVEEVDRLLGAEKLDEGLLVGLRPDVMMAALRATGPPAQTLALTGWLTRARVASISDGDLDDITRPYRQLLAAIGSGVPLSAAGWLPPALVAQLCAELNIDGFLAGKANRESNVGPLATFRKVVVQTGLLHSQYGRLMPTAKGIQYADHPHLLWQHLASRLPTGRGEIQRDAGYYALLALAGGVDRHEVYDEVYDLCTAAGWPPGPLAGLGVNKMVWPVMAALVGPRWNGLQAWPTWVPDAAAAVLFARSRT